MSNNFISILCTLQPTCEKKTFFNGYKTLKNKSSLRILRSTEFPPIAAFITQNKSSHRFVSRPRLYLIVSAISLLALSAFEEISFCSLYGGQLCIVYSFLLESFPQLFDFIVGHLFRRHNRQSGCGNSAYAEIGSQGWIFYIFQISNPRSHTIFVSHIGVLEFLVNGLLQFFCQFLR